MKLSYDDQIKQALNKAKKHNSKKMQGISWAPDSPEETYYKQQFGKLACASWEQFKGSWAGTEWMKKHFPQG